MNSHCRALAKDDLSYCERKSFFVVDVGIRGTNIAVSHDGIEAVVEYVEMIEADLIIHAKAEEKEIIIVEKMSGSNESRYLNGQEINLMLDEKYFHLFNKEGNRLN